MAIFIPDGVTATGAVGAFFDGMDSAPNIWKNYVTEMASTQATETHATAGFVPIPRRMLDGRSIQSMIDISFNVENFTYELTFGVKREAFEDDQTGTIQMRFQESGESFGQFKDSQFKDLLEDNGAPPMASDGNVTAATFFAASIIVGGSGTMDNDLAVSATAADNPTTAEMKTAIGLCRETLRGFTDDKGRPFNGVAAQKLRVLVPPEQEVVTREALGATIIANTSNAELNMAEMDVLDYLTDPGMIYVAALGAARKPFLMQNRSPLEIIVDTDPGRVAERNAVMVLCRERYRLTYGDPRRMVRHDSA